MSMAEQRAPAGRIVVADADSGIRAQLTELLHPRWQVEAVADGRAALDAIRRDPPDLVLAGESLPLVDGAGIIRSVRRDPAHQHIAVILLSARAGETARIDGMRAGADDFILEPFAAAELVARVAAAVDLSGRRRAGGSGGRLSDVNRDLRDRVSELETLLGVIPVGIGIALDRECRRIHVNPAFAATLGILPDANASLSAPEGERPTTFHVRDVHGNRVAAENLPLQRAARDGRETRDKEFDIVHDDGRVVRLLEYAAPLFDDDRQPRGAIGAFIDITERRHSEARG
jgi:PAS domain S-box-containing protein